MTSRLVLVTRCSVLACAALLIFSGRPPAKAQDGAVPTQRMVTSTDEEQDIEIGKLKDFKTNQENWNTQTGKDVAEALMLSRATDNKLSGGLGLIALFTALGIGFQFVPGGSKSKKVTP